MTTITTLEVARLNAAEAIAELAHFGQKDKQGRPYIWHVQNVARRCSDLEPDQKLAAILHDVIEDSDISRQTILNLFGREVHDIVDALTRFPGWTYEEYIDRVMSIPAAIPIKLADLEDNLDPSRDGEMDAETRQKIDSLRERYRKAKARLQARLRELEDDSEEDNDEMNYPNA